MKTEKEVNEAHAINNEIYLGKKTDKGVIEEVQYLTFVGGSGGVYHKLPQIGGKGLIVGKIGDKCYPVGELVFEKPKPKKFIVASLDELIGILTTDLQPYNTPEKNGRITKNNLPQILEIIDDKKPYEHYIFYGMVQDKFLFKYSPNFYQW